MSAPPDQPSIWTPESISCIVYRAVMIVVGIAFIWRKYRRPARHIDGNCPTCSTSLPTHHTLHLPHGTWPLHLTPHPAFFPSISTWVLTQYSEEQLIGVILPTYNTPLRRTRSTNEPSQQIRTNSRSRPTHTTLSEIISAHIEDIIQSALGIDDDELNINVLRTSFDRPGPASSIPVTAGSSLDKGGLDIELGDVGLRHRSADSMVQNKKCLRDENLKVSSWKRSYCTMWLVSSRINNFKNNWTFQWNMWIYI